jgi:DNA repair protein RecN (Recombination protein N)
MRILLQKELAPEKRERELKEKTELYQFQIKELETAGLNADEEEELLPK